MPSSAGHNNHSQLHHRRRSVLVIEDETDVQVLLKEILADDGYHVTLAPTARQALAVIRDTGFDVVIADLSLPDADGLDLVRHIGAESPHVHVIAISGFMAAMSPAALHRAGAAATLQKPFTAEQLLDSVSKLLNLHYTSAAKG
jgi:DNA-binding NtrC family response regulator